MLKMEPIMLLPGRFLGTNSSIGGFLEDDMGELGDGGDVGLIMLIWQMEVIYE